MTQPHQTRRVKEALARVRILFLDPGARLTTADAAQMAGLDRQVCRALLQNLVEAGFLEQRRPGVFVQTVNTGMSSKTGSSRSGVARRPSHRRLV